MTRQVEQELLKTDPERKGRPVPHNTVAVQVGQTERRKEKAFQTSKLGRAPLQFAEIP